MKRTWLITGCSSGLERGIAEAALRHGENVALTARNPKTIWELAAQYPEQAMTLRLNLQERESMRKLRKRSWRRGWRKFENGKK
ncbi:hypothetical protein B5E77_15495 [Lachnoclostridium sp. An131]|uniref:SDR family NAD(P)-dependent oxidoreductase n=1 Tax=Lachnoclostridium sp. An131 TaxID=1965555 RepID=UPI000B366CFB|nr:SDR family NAD(P)-dependent oxidoreductase [Lachnoclostridium sp. An131]OUQ23460.1 hypothetical protein B5E77_15495 [Lachnoclostridium sp. An131]